MMSTTHKAGQDVLTNLGQAQVEINQWVLNLISDDPKRKIQAATDIKKIAEFIGPSRTRNELLKYFYEFYDDNDEVIDAFVSQLDNFVDSIGGPSFTAKLMPHFERICYVDNIAARDKCVDILQSIAKTEFNNKEAQF